MKASKLIYIILLIFTVILVVNRFNSLRNDDQDQIDFLIVNFADRIKNEVDKSINILYLMEYAILEDIDNFTEEKFIDLVSVFYDEKQHINVSYMPDGIVKYIYKESESEIARVGNNLLVDDYASVDARTTIESKKFGFSGPFNLISGESALIARLPIYSSENNVDSFIGFISLVVSTDALIDNLEFERIEDFNYRYKLVSNYQGNEVVFDISDNFDPVFASEYKFNIGNSQWILYLYNPSIISSNLYILVALTLTTFVASTLVYLVVRKVETLQQAAKKEVYVDQLTRAYNRKMFDKFIKEVKNVDKFTIYYMDLNDFKPINDNYGHEAGDKLLIAFVERCKTNLKKDTLLIRMGGDEFVIIIDEGLSDDTIISIKNRIENFSMEQFIINDILIKISVSIGYASYPKDDTNIQNVLALADRMMYDNKSNKKR